MTLISPFRGLRPLPERADDVVAPPYDVVNTEEARARAQGRPWSFLHISKPEIDLPPGTDPYAPQVYEKGSENLERLIREGILRRDEEPGYYVYRQVMDGHIQTGLVAVASVAAYDGDRIRKHELTRPDKEDDRVRQIDALNAQTGPVFLTYRRHPEVDALIESVAAGEAEYDIRADDGVQHTVWLIQRPEMIARVTELFEGLDGLYIADGHHRSAAAARVAAMRARGNPTHRGDESYNHFLSVMIPDNQVQILDYNRVVKDLNDMSPDQFLARVGESFEVATASDPVRPDEHGEFGMYLAGQWYRLRIDPARVPSDDPIRRLDVSLLANNLIDPVLGISDPRRDSRIDFVGGIRGLQELEKRVDRGEMAVAFSLYPTTLNDLMAVADAGEFMPPKTTWFEPKLADGLVSHVLD